MPTPASAHPRQHRAQGVKESGHVGLDGQVDVAALRREEVVHPAPESCIVDQHVDFKWFERCVEGLGVAQVERQRRGAGLARQGFQAIGAPRGRHDFQPLGAQRAHRRFADPRPMRR